MNGLRDGRQKGPGSTNSLVFVQVLDWGKKGAETRSVMGETKVAPPPHCIIAPIYPNHLMLLSCYHQLVSLALEGSAWPPLVALSDGVV